MNGRATTGKMVATKSKNKVLSCSTPDHTLDSPSRDSDSMCDSDTASPIPFLCTQDGSDNVTDVIWNYYNTSTKNSNQKNSTPVRRKTRIPHRLKLPEKELQQTFHKQKVTRLSQKKLQLPQELLELNEYVEKLMQKKNKPSDNIEKPQSGSEEDIFNDGIDCSPKSAFRVTRCLRKNVLQTKFAKPESDNGLESDDSINECLLKASQAVEETILKDIPSKKQCVRASIKRNTEYNVNDNSMDAILKNIKSPCINKFKCESPRLKNDSFDNFVEDLNDSALEQLSRMPVKNSPISSNPGKCKASAWQLQEIVVNDASPSSKISFTRHSSMPESPSMTDNYKPTCSAMPIGRYKSMPFNDSSQQISGDSPIRCTPLEIQKKHQQAREKLLAKRLLPFTQTQTHESSSSLPSKLHTKSKQTMESQRKSKFQPKYPKSIVTSPKVPETIVNPDPYTSKQHDMATTLDHTQTEGGHVLASRVHTKIKPTNESQRKLQFGPKYSNATVTSPKHAETISNSEQYVSKQNNIPTNMDLRSLIEKKRQEALMKLRRKQQQK